MRRTAATWRRSPSSPPTLEQAKAIAAAHPSVIANFYAGAGHGFNCDERGSYNEAAAKLARQRALEFLGRHIG